MRSSPRLLPVLLLTLSAIVPVQAQSHPAAGRDTVVIGAIQGQEPDTLNPIFSIDYGPALATVPDIHAAIFTVDVGRDNDTWRVFPQGVEYLPTVRNGTWTVDGERMTLFWKIKPRRWHDGRPVTCADYVFSHTVARNKQVGVTSTFFDPQGLTSRIASVSCPQGADGREITVHWIERYGYANQVVVPFGALPRHIIEPFYRANPSTLRDAPYGHDPKVTIGDGPYRLVEWRRRVSLTVDAVADHPIFGTPRIRRITWKVFSDTKTMVANLLSGAIDAVGLQIAEALELERQGAGGRVKVVWQPGLGWGHIDFNLDNPLLQDVRVRRALAHGINLVQINQQLFGGRLPVSHSYLPPRHPGYTEDVQKYPYDPTRARALLREAGFAPGPDGILHNAAEQRLSLELTTTAGNRSRELSEQIIQEQLRQVGIEITILNYPPRVLFGEITQKRKFKALVLYNWVFAPIDDCNGYYTSDGIPNEGNNWTGGNYPGYRNAEMDRVCKAISRELDEEKRNRLLNDSARLFARDLPALPLFTGRVHGAVKPGLRNFVIGIEPMTWNAHRWYWE